MKKNKETLPCVICGNLSNFYFLRAPGEQKIPCHKGKCRSKLVSNIRDAKNPNKEYKKYVKYTKQIISNNKELILSKEEELEFIREGLANKMKIYQIADKLNVHPTGVGKKIYKYNLRAEKQDG